MTNQTARSSQGTNVVATGLLQIYGGLALDTTLRFITDQAGTSSTLKLSTTGIESTGTSLFSGLVTFSLSQTGSTATQLASGDWKTSSAVQPFWLIQPTNNAAALTWNTLGTGFGINAASGFTGDLVNFGVNGISKARIKSTGEITTISDISLTSSGGQVKLSGAKLQSSTDSKLQLLNNAESTFNQLYFGTTSKPSICQGSGTPEANQTAAIGSIYMRSDGGVLTSVYVKQSGTGNTGWIAIA